MDKIEITRDKVGIGTSPETSSYTAIVSGPNGAVVVTAPTQREAIDRAVKVAELNGKHEQYVRGELKRRLGATRGHNAVVRF